MNFKIIPYQFNVILLLSVNIITFLQAREEATRTDKYYWTTILRLRARAALYNVGPGTPYYKFNY